jgi:low affinity Fe/Cu permease
MESGLFKNSITKIFFIIGILILLFFYVFNFSEETVSDMGPIYLPEDNIREGWEGATFISVTYLVFVMIYLVMGYILENVRVEHKIDEKIKKVVEEEEGKGNI